MAAMPGATHALGGVQTTLTLEWPTPPVLVANFRSTSAGPTRTCHTELCSVVHNLHQLLCTYTHPSKCGRCHAMLRCILNPCLATIHAMFLGGFCALINVAVEASICSAGCTLNTLCFPLSLALLSHVPSSKASVVTYLARVNARFEYFLYSSCP
jgi:hypothetical protein